MYLNLHGKLQHLKVQKLLQIVLQQCCVASLGVMLRVLRTIYPLLQVACKGLRRVEVTFTCRNVLRQLATWKCVARHVAGAGSNTCNIVLNFQRNIVATQVETIILLVFLHFTSKLHGTNLVNVSSSHTTQFSKLHRQGTRLWNFKILWTPEIPGMPLTYCYR